ncbi:unnamed protein product [Cunninghamella blakesleeana]
MKSISIFFFIFFLITFCNIANATVPSPDIKVTSEEQIPEETIADVQPDNLSDMQKVDDTTITAVDTDNLEPATENTDVTEFKKKRKGPAKGKKNTKKPKRPTKRPPKEDQGNDQGNDQAKDQGKDQGKDQTKDQGNDQGNDQGKKPDGVLFPGLKPGTLLDGKIECNKVSNTPKADIDQLQKKIMEDGTVKKTDNGYYIIASNKAAVVSKPPDDVEDDTPVPYSYFRDIVNIIIKTCQNQTEDGDDGNPKYSGVYTPTQDKLQPVCITSESEYDDC